MNSGMTKDEYEEQQQQADTGIIDKGAVNNAVDAVNNTINLAQQPQGIEHLQTQAGAFLKGRTYEQEAQWRQQKQADFKAASDQYAQQIDEATDIPTVALREGTRAVLGGGQDAVKSLGEFADLSGDTLKHGFNKLLGNPTQDEENPWSTDYEKGNWIDIPYAVRENKTGWGKLARGLVEFGLLTRLTGAGSSVIGSATGVTRTANAAIAGNKYINFVAKGTKITLDGGAADLISSSSEMGNIANLVEQYAPWMLPEVMAMLAVRPEDNPWEARIKTVAAGAGMNHVGHFLGAILKGAWRSIDDLKAGKTVAEANENGNKVFRQDMEESLLQSEANATEAAANRLVEGRGISRADPRDQYIRQYLTEEEYARHADPNTSSADRAALDDLANRNGVSAGDEFDWVEYRSANQAIENAGRQPDALVNPESATNVQKATYGRPPNATQRAVGEAVLDTKNGGDGRTFTNIVTEPQIRNISLGNASLRQVVEEVTEDIANSVFHQKSLSASLPKGMSYAEFKTAAYKMAEPLLAQLDNVIDGNVVDLARAYKKILEKPKDFRWYGEVDGKVVKTVGPLQKSANIIALRSLARTVSDLGAAGMTLVDDVDISRQAEMMFDAMKVLFIENKKFAFMSSLDLKSFQKDGFSLTAMAKAGVEDQMSIMAKQADEFFGELDKLRKEGDWQAMKDLLELEKLSDGKVRTQAHILEFLQAKMYGGRMDGIDIRGQTRKQLQSTFFNSILSGLKTAPKAIIGTNMIAYSRPLMAAMGSIIKGDRKELAIALATLDSMSRASAESWQMWRYNWDLGVNRKSQVYAGKFDLDQDMLEWKVLGEKLSRYGSETDKMAYGSLDFSVKFNTSPWVKYSANAMGAGDAFARTIIGRQYMAQRAARAALDEGIDPKNIKDFVRQKEELFRKEIFVKNKDGMWIVSDKAAAMAGDEAAMTTALEGSIKGFEAIANLPGMRAFFPFVRTGFNYLDVTFQHTPVGLFRQKYRDLTAKGGPRNLEKYGLRPQDVAQEVALAEGRIAVGTSATLLVATAGLSGNITGNIPWDPAERKRWRDLNIQPFSIRVGDAWVSYKNVEIFNTLFAFGADIHYGSHLLGEKGTDHMMRKLVWMFSSVVVEQSMLGGLSDLLQILSPEASEEMRTAAISRIARSQVPFKGLSGDLGTIVDANHREATGFWEELKKKDLLFKNNLHPKYDVLSKDKKGRVKPYHTEPLNPLLRIYNRISPIAIVPIDNDPVRQALIDIRYDLPHAMSTLKGVDLNSRERSQLQYELANGNLRERLEKLINSGRFKGSLEQYKIDGLKDAAGWDHKDAYFYNEVNRIFKEEKELARQRMAADPINNALMQKIADRKAQKEALKQGSIPQIKNLNKRLQKHGI